MKNVKKYLISLSLSLGVLFSLITPISLQCSAEGVLTAIGLIDTVEKALKYTITIGNALESENPLDEALLQSGHGNLVGATVDQSLTNYLGQSECRIASYTFLYGKYTYKYTDTTAVNRELMVTCSMYYTNSTPTNQSETYPERVITGADGLQYLTNNIYFTIYRDDGYYKRYRYQCHSDMIFTQQFATATWSGSTGCLTSNGVTIHRDSNSDYYDVSDGSLLGSNTGWGGSSRDISFIYSQNNTIVFNGVGQSYNATTYTRYEYKQLDSSWSSYPEDKEICYCYLSNVRERSSSSSSTRYVVPRFVLGYFDTNDYGNNRYFYSDYGNTNQNYFNYYYDNSYQADTIINNNNKSTVFDGTLANAFDINGNVIMPVDLEADIKPKIDLAVADLNTKITNFFDDMPDFNAPWSNRNTDNNYFDLIVPEEPSSGGDGCNWETPYYPALNTSVYIPANVPTYQTYAAQTMPSSYIEGTGDWFYFGYGLFDELGLTVFIIPLVILGLFWRFTGGD